MFLQGLVGLSPTAFDQLMIKLEPLWERAHHRSLLRAGRVRRIGAGNTFKLDLSQRLLVTYLYLRQYFTMHVLGILFDLDAANICWNIHGLLPCVLGHSRPSPTSLPVKRAGSRERYVCWRNSWRCSLS